MATYPLGMRGRGIRVPLSAQTIYANVVEGQSRQIEGLVTERSWGFNSPHSHNVRPVGGMAVTLDLGSSA
jgi:hypothetical protein